MTSHSQRCKGNNPQNSVKNGLQNISRPSQNLQITQFCAHTAKVRKINKKCNISKFYLKKNKVVTQHCFCMWRGIYVQKGVCVTFFVNFWHLSVLWIVGSAKIFVKEEKQILFITSQKTIFLGMLNTFSYCLLKATSLSPMDWSFILQLIFLSFTQ